ncbi:PhzF family phenazine biosynthesis protein [Dermatobacter hominis]|uniref:PhzF family phenazine biosynthesis protein n=1 Tax=Dermatobacter hominis TaxID=2884263 RepID=UPI001D0F91F1|nr:PhzF family phenazine biosynthesis protein [Dermatobacter hominis]UDY35113.1 PhzF family phenazine biosynthesis protein [Dermatobacter hominis]
MGRPFRQVDVFGVDPCTGNPVAVVLDADDLTTEDMRRTSAWTNLSECTFVLPPTAAGADYRVRIFSLRTELPFAGHPTLGTAAAWLDAGGRPADPGTVVQECGIGLVPIRVGEDALSFSAPPRLRSGPVDGALLAEVLAVLGVDAAAVVDAEWLDNGPGWVGVLLDGTETLRSLVPDLAGRTGQWDIGVVAPAPEGSEVAFELRAFFTDGVAPPREDPVTGSLNAAAAQWLLSSGRATAPYVMSQGAALGRSGRIHVDEDADGIWVGGRTHVVVAGQVDLG